ncbi:hypothetical protein EJ08DRAFT_660945 [Tothia fuscella]|uniref:Uncharacterized protein n=1 Tax=Tothia fuscella TaxID=1048955 RepID=A0A9P4NQI4_9PEZI|nr:hypothetical protein EJ08DRAFT_660945 [Tothia fuscella]
MSLRASADMSLYVKEAFLEAHWVVWGLPLGAPCETRGGVGNALGSTLGGLLGVSGSNESTDSKPAPSPKAVFTPRPPTTARPPPPKQSTAPHRGGDSSVGDNGEKGSNDRGGGGGNEHKEDGNQKKLPRLSVITGETDVICRKFADTISPDPSTLLTYKPGTKIEATCYTNSEMKGTSGNVRGDSTWLKTSGGCFVNKMEIQDKQDFQAILEYCAPPKHWVGTLKSQYVRVDCYDCTTLDCPSRNVGVPPYVDLACSLQGEAVQGNSTWLRSQAQACYLPSSVFNPYGFLGTPGGRC